MNKALEGLKMVIGKEAKEVSPSPYGAWLNGKLLAVEEGHLEMEFTVRKEWANPSGMIHGGIYAGIMDDVIGMTSYTLGREHFYAAVNLNVDFLRPSQVGEKLIVKCQVIRPGKSVLHLECQIFGEDGKLKAKAASNLAKTAFGFA
ncbi:PaaI family thioesterase [Marinilongibacter aquaticus]|uniref:PaaI family thioesterase n=1 Tax=Marinilongibacter aquaticus TaxID=2975157 RepID=UPI0021BDEA1B|nr:PaaI family thioesterase [Marinilongibacter aquaticus]UBM57578.1 PaaI family thioesterase [Marinilongibacter aquaticus]